MGHWYTCARTLCRIYMSCCHVCRIQGRAHVPVRGGALLVSNHQSFLDPVIVGHGLTREIDYMARESLFDVPRFGGVIRSVNAFPVRRGETDISAVKTTLRKLKAGRLVLLFPEQTRTPDGRIRRFKPGLAIIARKAKVPVIPVVIDGAFEAWPRTKSLPRVFSRITVAFSRSLSADNLEQDGPDAFVELVHRQMIEIQHELRRRAGKAIYDYSDMDR